MSELVEGAAIDVFDVLKSDHSRLRKLIGAIAEIINSEDKQSALPLFKQLKAELTLHSKSKSAAVYAQLLHHEEFGGLAREGGEDQALIDGLLMKISQYPAVDDHWESAFAVLRELVEHHASEEEAALFGALRKTFTKAELESMGDDMLTEKVAIAESTGIDQYDLARPVAEPYPHIANRRH